MKHLEHDLKLSVYFQWRITLLFPACWYVLPVKCGCDFLVMNVISSPPCWEPAAAPSRCAQSAVMCWRRFGAPGSAWGSRTQQGPPLSWRTGRDRRQLKASRAGLLGSQQGRDVKNRASELWAELMTRFYLSGIWRYWSAAARGFPTWQINVNEEQLSFWHDPHVSWKQSFIHLLVYSLIHQFSSSLIDSFIHPFTYS